MAHKEVNFEAIYDNVGTQYGDLTGVIQIDGHENISSIYKLCDDLKIDLKGKFLIGFGLTESTILGVGQSDSVDCAILYVDKDSYGSNYDEIEKSIRANGGTLKAKKI